MLAKAAVLCLLVAACGGPDQATVAFKKGYVQASGPLEQTGAAIAVAIAQARHRSDAQLASEFSELADRFNTELLNLETLKAPSSVSGAYAALTAAANRLEDDLLAISTAAGHHNPTVARTAVEGLVADASTLNANAATIRHAVGIN